MNENLATKSSLGPPSIGDSSEIPVVSMREVSKRFGAIQALDHVSLDIPAGRIVGLLGANGSGKSTLLRHMIGLYLADTGECQTYGVKTAHLGPAELARIGYVHQEGQLLQWMTVRQIIRYVAAYYDTWNGELERRLVKEFELPLESRVAALSPGQRQRLAILLAVGFEPELLILDEPAAGLDPLARAQFLNLLLQIIQKPNRTILISSHILSDVEKVIDHAIIMKKGRIIRDTSFDDLLEEFCHVQLRALDGYGLPGKLPFEHVLKCERDTAGALLTLQNPPEQEALESLAAEIHCSVERRGLSLEEIYILVVG